MIGLISYVLYTTQGAGDLLQEIEQEKKYNKYLENNNCKRFEYIPHDDRKNEKIDRYVLKELNLCDEYIKNNPKNLFARARRSFLYSMLNRYEDAINDCRYLMMKKPKNFSYVEHCANFYAQQNDLNSALELINSFYRNKKQDSEYFNALGNVFSISKNHELAIRNYSEAIKLKPHWLYYSNRANVYHNIGEKEKYEADNDKYIKLQEAALGTNNDDTETKPKEEIVSKPFFKNSAIYKIIFILLAFIAISYFHPTKETMHCNQNHICKIERTYFGIFKINKEMTLDYTSKMSCHIGSYGKTKRNTKYGLYLKYNNISPFIFYVADSAYGTYEYQMEELNEACHLHRQAFKKYINSYGKYQYSILTKASTGKLMFGIFMILLVLVVMFGEDIKKLKNK